MKFRRGSVPEEFLRSSSPFPPLRSRDCGSHRGVNTNGTENEETNEQKFRSRPDNLKLESHSLRRAVNRLLSIDSLSSVFIAIPDALSRKERNSTGGSYHEIGARSGRGCRVLAKSKTFRMTDRTRFVWRPVIPFKGLCCAKLPPRFDPVYQLPTLPPCLPFRRFLNRGSFQTIPQPANNMITLVE